MSDTSETQDYQVRLPPRIIWEPDGKEMILIPDCAFVMGQDGGPANEGPQHIVTVEAYYIDRYPVTQAEYQNFCQETGHTVPCYELEWTDREYNWDPETATPPADKIDHPVTMVSWEDAVTYATWAQKRLPTEAEWERAARGCDGLRWPWGDGFDRGRCNTQDLNIGRTTSVYRFSPRGDSPDGVSDMVGNVWEWTLSLYKPYPYNTHDGRESLTSKGWRVLRGGSWRNEQTLASTTSRLDGDFLFFTNVGFRCAVSIDQVVAALQGGGE